MKKGDIDYESFDLRYRVGRKAYHLVADGSVRTLCGLTGLGLLCKGKPDDKLCKNCKKDVTIIKVRRQNVALFRGPGRRFEAHVETK